MLLPTTKDIISSALKGDPTITPDARKRMLKLLCDAPTLVEKADRIMTREEVAKLLNISVRCVDKWAAEDLIPRVIIPGRKRALGFRRSDVEALIIEKVSEA